MQLPSSSSKNVYHSQMSSKKDVMAHTHMQAQELEGLWMPMLKPPPQQCRRLIFLQEKQELQQ